MLKKTKFVVHKHEAKRAGLHFDLRIRIDKDKWASFVVRKGIPEKPGKRHLAIRTHDHSDKEALMVGIIDDGYGAGKLSVYDKGECIIEKYKNAHMVFEFKGKKIKGIYHLINTAVVRNRVKDYKGQQYFLFKSKLKKV
ncbi:3'-phosphoesterase [Candidatus Pacearchaeota archaeon]|nr:3'-phosphoesterase [Candidatus Pacearchaeota archaeon]